MTEQERQKRIQELRERMRDTDELIERRKVQTARVLAQLDRVLDRLAASR